MPYNLLFFLVLSTRDGTEFGERLSVLEPGKSSTKFHLFFFLTYILKVMVVLGLFCVCVRLVL